MGRLVDFKGESMTNRLFVLFALACALFIGCRSSAKSAQATPTPSPTPVAQVQELAPPTATPAQPEVSLGPPIPVTPPASFSAEQVNDQVPQFIVQGRAGQFLRVKVNAGSGVDPTQSVSAQLLGVRPRFIDAIRKGGDCSGNFVYSLPETGKYEIELDPAGRQMGIDFSMLASNDPLIDPGIKPDQISMDLGSLAKGKQMKLEPFGQWEGCMGDWEPSHWALEAKGFEFRIMQVAGYKKVFSGPGLAGDAAVMENLEAAVKPGAKIPANIGLPYPAYGDAGLNFSTRPQLLEGDGWRGLRFLASYGQDTGCWFDDSAYVFEGISNDGRFFVLMRAAIANPRVARRLAQECKTAAEKTPPKDETFFKDQVPEMFDKAMSAADPASFQPNLNQLDAVIKSLKLKP